MADKIQNAYEAAKNIYDEVLTQGNFFSKMYIKMFWSGTDDNDIDIHVDGSMVYFRCIK